MQFRRVFRGRVVHVAGPAALLVVTVALAGSAAAATTTPVSDPVIHVPPLSTLGRPLTVSITPDGYGAAPAGYQYRINGGRAQVAPADRSGDARFTFTATTRAYLLQVASLATLDSQPGPTVTGVALIQREDPPAADGDLTADGLADLVVVGTPGGLGEGLWLAAGQKSGAKRGSIGSPAVNIAPDGPLGAGAGNPPFAGSVAMTGDFFGDGYQSVLTYFGSGPNAGTTFLLHGSGDGSALSPGDEDTMPSGTMTDLNGDNPIAVANAYNASGSGFVYPDLIAISGDPSVGFYLEYIANSDGVGANFMTTQLPNATPTGGTDWNNWQLASTRIPSGTALFLWNRSTGALYLWTSLSFVDNGDSTGSLSFTQYLISSSWNAGADLTLQAADFNRDGVPDLWAVDSSGIAIPWLVSNLSTTHVAVISAQPSVDLR